MIKFLKVMCPAAAVLAILLSFLPWRGEGGVYDDVLRLHVVAASDSDYDQSVKLKVRDAVLGCLRSAMAEATSREEAERAVAAAIDEAVAAANAVLAAEGADYTATAAICSEAYPTRVYDSCSLPAGTYRSLVVTLGGGEGKNWWCVLFPPMCLSASVSRDDFVAAGFTPEEYRMITEKSPKYEIRFRIVEFIESLLGRKNASSR
jgi:stage II sporulation protein R